MWGCPHLSKTTSFNHLTPRQISEAGTAIANTAMRLVQVAQGTR